MSVGIVTLAEGNEYRQMAALVEPGKRAYCARYGHSFIAFHTTLNVTRPPAWSKIPAILNVLDRFEWVLWTDVDTVLWNPDLDLRQFLLESSSVDMIVREDAQGINTGLFFVRNRTWTRHFLNRVYDQTQFLLHPWWEQRAMMELLQDAEIARHVRVHANEPGQPGFHGFFDQGDWHSLFIHLPAIPLSDRVRLVENLTRLAEYPAHLRLLTRDGFGPLLNRLGLFGEGAEVGVGDGAFSRRILDTWEGRTLHLIDAWRHLPDYTDIANVSDDEHDARMQGALRSLASHTGRYTIHRMLSAEAARNFAVKSLDFVYIDANHDFEAVAEDIRLWYPKVKPGGLIAGHDYRDGELPEGRFGVRQAVQEFEGSTGLRVAVTTERDWPTWYAVKPQC
jgi:hypothetical protein